MTSNFILMCLGCYQGACAYMDKLADTFDLEMCSDDVERAAIAVCENLKKPMHESPQLGNDLITVLFDKINAKAQDKYPLYAEQIRDLFGYYAEDYASSLTFNDEEVHNWKELCQAIEHYINEQESWNE